MIPQLYYMYQRWSYNTVWITSDLHFGDEKLRAGFPNRPSDEELIKRINSKVGKKDTLLCLGDCGNLDYVRQLKGYKVLICGNHDAGETNYWRNRIDDNYHCSEFAREEALKKFYEDHPEAKSSEYTVEIRKTESYTLFEDYDWDIRADNHLFNEVYTGALTVGEKLILSHEPLAGIPWALNLHGHDHSGRKGANGTHYNCCLEVNDYLPINLNQLMKQGLMSKIPSIHRITIDAATERKKKRGGKLISRKR